MTEFDTDTALDATGDGVFTGTITDRWMIGGGPNGGYVAALLARAFSSISPQPDPLTMTTHYVGRPEPGQCEVRVDITSATRSHAFLNASLVQDGTVRAHGIAIFGQRRADQLVDMLRSTPAHGAPGDGEPRLTPPPAEMSPMMTFLDRFDHRIPGGVDMFSGDADAEPVVGGWTRLLDRDLDNLAVPLFADCWPPPMFRRHSPGMAPTIELTVHFRNNPEPGWNWCRFESRALAGGYVEEDGEIWSESGALVAQSRQLSRFSLLR